MLTEPAQSSRSGSARIPRRYTVPKPLPPAPHPTLVNLESTLGCNLECVMCGSHLAGVTKTRKIMPPELLAKVEAQVLPGVRDLSLTVAGEPFMTPKMPSFVDLAERTGAQLQLNTNATLIKEGDLLRRVLRAASVVKVSIDGATKETYESIRVKADFDVVVANIAALVRTRDALGREERPRLAMCMVLMRRNVEELVAMVELAHRLRVDRLEVAHLIVLTPEMDAESLRHHAALSDRMLRAARERADTLGLHLALPPLMDGTVLAASPGARLREVGRELGGLTRKRLRRLGRTVGDRARRRTWELRAGGQVPCDFLMGGLFVNLQGDVAPCPMPGRPFVGNLLEQDFDTIWNGETLTAMRRGFLTGRPFDCCQHCSQNKHGYRPADDETAFPPGFRRRRG